MNEKQIGLLVIGPLIVGTGVLLWRQGALGGKALVAIAAAVAAVVGFLVATL